jgi:hypothetical protein
MTARGPQVPQAVVMPTPVESGEPFSVGLATYRTSHELTYYLRALNRVCDGRLVVVLALRSDLPEVLTDLPANVRLILTSEGGGQAPTEPTVWWIPDPLRAVVVALTGRQPEDGLILLFPHDWQGPSPEELLEKARRWRSSPHSPEDDVHFVTD